jgi:hypothetical protein
MYGGSYVHYDKNKSRKWKMITQEQRITRGSIVIFILSIILLACLCLTATLAYFAGKQTSDMTLILGGPVRITIRDNRYNETVGDGNLVMNIKTGREELLPGMGIDVQAIAHITSSQINSTKALLRAKVEIEVTNLLEISDPKEALEAEKDIEKMIEDSLYKCLTYRQEGERHGWVLFDDGNFYYCDKDNYYDEKENKEYIQLLAINTSDEGEHITFINGTFQFPSKYYRNMYAHAEILFTLRFEAIQEILVNEDGDRVPNTIFNVKNVLDGVDWDKHND